MIALIWIVSSIVLIATAVLVYKMLVTSKEFFTLDKPFPFRLSKLGNSQDKFKQSLTRLNSKIKSLEDSNAYYEIQFSKLQLQLKSEKNVDQTKMIDMESNTPSKAGEEEDWEEMYYQENEQKVQIENELDKALQNLEQVNQKLLNLEKKDENIGSLRSNYDATLMELNSLQNKMDGLQNKLEAAAEREHDLNKLLQKEIDLKKIYAKIENENVRLRSETQDQKRQITEMFVKEKEISKQLARSREMQSQEGMYEDEKNRKMDELKKQMENNRIFSK